MNTKISIIISAFNASEYIEECIMSVVNQSYFKLYNNYEIILGIDNCEDTLNEVIKFKDNIHNLKLVSFNENNGPYLVFNTLISISSGEYISIFGADDIMLSNFIEDNLMEIKNGSDFVIARGNNFNHPNKNKVIKTYNPDGVIIFNKSDFMLINGYEGWRCAADSDLKNRFNIMGLKCKHSENVTYLRRLHSDSITNSKNHGFNTAYRLRLKSIINDRQTSKIDKFKITKKYKII